MGSDIDNFMPLHFSCSTDFTEISFNFRIYGINRSVPKQVELIASLKQLGGIMLLNSLGK